MLNQGQSCGDGLYCVFINCLRSTPCQSQWGQAYAFFTQAQHTDSLSAVSVFSFKTPSLCLSVSNNNSSREWTVRSDLLQTSKTWPSPPATHLSASPACWEDDQQRKRDSMLCKRKSMSMPSPSFVWGTDAGLSDSHRWSSFEGPALGDTIWQRMSRLAASWSLRGGWPMLGYYRLHTWFTDAQPL